MNTTEHTILKRFGSFSRDLRFFTSTSTDTGVLSAKTVQMYLDDLLERGFIRQVRKTESYCITPAGRHWLDTEGRSAEPRRWCSNTTGETYVPPVWNIRAGAGEKSPNGRVQG